TGSFMRITVSSGRVPAGLSEITAFSPKYASPQTTAEAAAASTKLSTSSCYSHECSGPFSDAGRHLSEHHPVRPCTRAACRSWRCAAAPHGLWQRHRGRVSARKASCRSRRRRSRFVDRTPDWRWPLDAQFPYSHARGSGVQSKECSLFRTRLARLLQFQLERSGFYCKSQDSEKFSDAATSRPYEGSSRCALRRGMRRGAAVEIRLDGRRYSRPASRGTLGGQG